MKIIDKNGREKTKACDWRGGPDQASSDGKTSIGLVNPYTKILVGSSNVGDLDPTCRMTIVSGDIVVRDLVNEAKFTRGSLSTIYEFLTRKGSPPQVITKADITGCVSADTGFRPLVVYDNKLYFITDNSSADTDANGRKLYVFDGSQFQYYTRSQTNIGASDSVKFLGDISGKLYFVSDNGTVATDATATKILCFDGTTWTYLTKGDLGITANERILGNGIRFGDNKIIFGSYSTHATNVAKIYTFSGTGCSGVSKTNLFSGAYVYEFVPIFFIPSHGAAFVGSVCSGTSYYYYYVTLDGITWSGYRMSETFREFNSGSKWIGDYGFVMSRNSGGPGISLWAHPQMYLAYTETNPVISGSTRTIQTTIWDDALIIGNELSSIQRMDISGSQISVQRLGYSPTFFPKTNLPGPLVSGDVGLFPTSFNYDLYIMTTNPSSNMDSTAAKILLIRPPGKIWY